MSPPVIAAPTGAARLLLLLVLLPTLPPPGIARREVPSLLLPCSGLKRGRRRRSCCCCCRRWCPLAVATRAAANTAATWDCKAGRCHCCCCHAQGLKGGRRRRRRRRSESCCCCHRWFSPLPCKRRVAGSHEGACVRYDGRLPLAAMRVRLRLLPLSCSDLVVSRWHGVVGLLCVLPSLHSSLYPLSFLSLSSPSPSPLLSAFCKPRRCFEWVYNRCFGVMQGDSGGGGGTRQCQVTCYL